MKEPIRFKTQQEWRSWLSENCESSEGVWLLFGKTKAVETLTAAEALEEALCFGWIDGVMRRLDDTSYIKYFAQRRTGSKWSVKNKELALKLEESGRMTAFGRRKIEEAKHNGQWEQAVKPSAVSEEQLTMVMEVLKTYDLAYANFMNMPPSVKKTYTRAYLDAKTEAGRTKRLAWMVDRLEKNLKPM